MGQHHHRRPGGGISSARLPRAVLISAALVPQHILSRSPPSASAASLPASSPPAPGQTPRAPSPAPVSSEPSSPSPSSSEECSAARECSTPSCSAMRACPTPSPRTDCSRASSPAPPLPSQPRPGSMGLGPALRSRLGPGAWPLLRAPYLHRSRPLRASLLLEFVALVVLRLREPALARPFRIPGGFAAAVLAGVGPALLIAFALVAARSERVGPLPALAFAALVAALGPLAFGLARRASSPKFSAPKPSSKITLARYAVMVVQFLSLTNRSQAAGYGVDPVRRKKILS